MYFIRMAYVAETVVVGETVVVFMNGGFAPMTLAWAMVSSTTVSRTRRFFTDDGFTQDGFVD